MGATAIDEAKLEAFMGKALGDMGAIISAPLMVIGEKLGLYRAMAGAGPLTSQQVAERAGAGERYVREWLANQAAGGYVSYDADTDTFTLPDEHALALADEDSPFYILGVFESIASLYADEDKILEAFRTGEGFALTILPIVAAATVRALKEFPRMNASVVGDSLVIRRTINLGIAIDSEEGLLVPVVKSAEGMSVVGLAREIESLRRKVAEKHITADDLTGGSFTLSNPGREGNAYGFAIINQPQVGILRMGELKKRPVVIEIDGEDAIAIRTVMYLALSYDHRVIDGLLGNRFLYRVARILEEADFEL